MYDKHDSIGRMISILYRMGQTNMGKRLKPYNIGKGQFVFLAALLVKDGISQDELSGNFSCDKATATRAVQHLEKHGYVQRIQSVEDARFKIVFVTDKARKFEPLLLSFVKEWTETLLNGFNDDEKQLLLSLLKRSVLNTTKTTNTEGEPICAT